MDTLESELARHEQIVHSLRQEIEQERRAAGSIVASSAGFGPARGSDGNSQNRHFADKGSAEHNRALAATSTLYEVPALSPTRKSLSEAALEMMHHILDTSNTNTGDARNGRALLAAAHGNDSREDPGVDNEMEDEAVLLDFMMRGQQPRRAF